MDFTESRRRGDLNDDGVGACLREFGQSPDDRARAADQQVASRRGGEGVGGAQVQPDTGTGRETGAGAGADTRTALREAGCDDPAVDALVAAGIVAKAAGRASSQERQGVSVAIRLIHGRCE